jgi:hypothetical protein
MRTLLKTIAGGLDTTVYAARVTYHTGDENQTDHIHLTT